VNYQFGFECGVNYANKNLGAKASIVELPSYAGKDVTEADVGGNYIGDFSDPAGGKKVGEALLAKGVDVLFVAAGASGNGVFTAVKEAGNAWVIGCDVDQYDDGANGDSNIVLTSALKVMDINVQRQLDAIVEAVRTVSEAAGGDVPATSHPIPLVNVFRADEVRPSLSVDQALQAAPAREADQFKVPQILGEEP
jgi:basic membrane protein A